MLRNTISAAAGVYTDSSAPSASRGDSFDKLKALAKPVQTGPPRVNRLRNAYASGGQAAITDLTRPMGAPSLPEPGMDDPEGDGLLDRGSSDGPGQQGSGLNAEDPLALRREGRRVPRLADSRTPRHFGRSKPYQSTCAAPLLLWQREAIGAARFAGGKRLGRRGSTEVLPFRSSSSTRHIRI